MPTPKSRAWLDVVIPGITYTVAEHSAVERYFGGFNEDEDGWATSGSASVCIGGYTLAPIYEGTGQLLTGSEASGQVPVVRTMTGLTSGRSYTVTAQVRWYGLGTVSNAKVGVTGKAYGTPRATLTSGTWYTLTYTFTATSASHELRLEYTSGAASTSRMTWDAVSLVEDAWTETSDYLPLQLVSGTITLDETRAPYCEARLTVALPAEEYLEQINPYAEQRLVLTAHLSWDEPTKPDQTREFDLVLHHREIEHETGQLVLVGESDEAILIDWALLDDEVLDIGGLSIESSVNVAFDQATTGAFYLTSVDDADLDNTDPITVVTNLHPNPSAENDAAGYSSGSGSSACVRLNNGTFAPYPGGDTGYIRSTASASTHNFYIANAASIPAEPGDEITVTVYLRASVARSTTVFLRWYDSGNSTISTVGGATSNTSTSAWVRYEVTGTAPANTASLGAYVSSTGSSGGNFTYADAVQVTKTSAAIGYFDGNTATSGIDYYEWEGTPGNSPSRHMRQHSNLTIWEPGTTAWDWLDPIVKARGRRLFCDEQRVWRLVDPETYSVPGVVTVSEGVNATRGTDTISLQATTPGGAPVWYSGVVVIWRWLDAEGMQQTAYEYAGTPAKVRTIQVDRPFPGAGYAARELARAQGRGRVQDIDALANLDATPGMQLVTTMPGTPIQVGVLSAVTWRWGAEGDDHDQMTVTSRGLLDTPETAWIFAEGTWEDVAGIDWQDVDEMGE